MAGITQTLMKMLTCRSSNSKLESLRGMAGMLNLIKLLNNKDNRESFKMEQTTHEIMRNHTQ